MTLNFNSRYAMKYNLSQSWIYNFQKFLGEHPPDHLEGQNKIFLATRGNFFRGSTNFSLILNIETWQVWTHPYTWWAS